MTVNEKGLEAALLPCPFCGYPASESDGLCVIDTDEFGEKTDNVSYAGVSCAGCAALVPINTMNKAEAIAAWNCRAASKDAEPVAWPGRKFCETAERNVAKLANFLANSTDKDVAQDAALAIRTLLAHPSTGGEGGVRVKAREALIEAIADELVAHGEFSSIPSRNHTNASKAAEAILPIILTAIEPVAASPGVGDVRTYEDGVRECLEIVRPGPDRINNGDRGYLAKAIEALLTASPVTKETEPVEALLETAWQAILDAPVLSVGTTGSLPRLANCGRYLAEDNTGQWHYINHAGEWQTCPPPSAGTGTSGWDWSVDAVDALPFSLSDLERSATAQSARDAIELLESNGYDILAPSTTRVPQWKRPADDDIDAAWLNLLEKDDRSSPEEYPEQALISKVELTEIVASITSTDAERWRALMSSPKMHFMGSAGFEHVLKADAPPGSRVLEHQIAVPKADGYWHFGMEFWYGIPADDRYPDTFERQMLTAYVDAIRLSSKQRSGE